MNACNQTRPYMEKFLGGAASPEEVAAFEAHAATCSPCHGAFAEVAAYDTAMKAVVPALAVPFSNPREAVLGNIEVGHLMGKPVQPYRVPRWRAVRWVLMLGFLATLAITFEGIASVAIIKKKARRAEAEMEVRAISHFIHRFHADNRRLPETGNTAMVIDLMGHFRKPDRRIVAFPFEARRLDESQALDPWGRPYVYEARGRTFSFYSVGEDGRDDGGKGDDVTWTGTWTAGPG